MNVLQASCFVSAGAVGRSAIGQFNRSGNNSMVVPREYLEIVITRC